MNIRDELEDSFPGRVVEPEDLEDLPKSKFMVYVLSFEGRPIVLGHGERDRARIIFDDKSRITNGHIKAIIVRAYRLFGKGRFKRFLIECRDKAEAAGIENISHDSIGGNTRELPDTIKERMFSGFPDDSIEHMVLRMALCSSYDGISDLRTWHKKGIINDVVWGRIRSRLELEDLQRRRGDVEKMTDEMTYSLHLLEDFFRQSRIQKSLAAIDEYRISGWEKWWQIELALYLSEDEATAEWNMEVPFLTDQRQSRDQYSIMVDIAFRPKRLKRERFIFVELKQDNDYVACLRKMLQDAEKVFSSRSESVEGIQVRSFLTVGAYRRVEKKEVLHCLASIQDDYKAAVAKEDVRTMFIPNTGYSFTILEPAMT